MKSVQSPRRALCAIFVALALAGCAQQRIRDEATSHLREGNFEVAIQSLQSGVDQFPESALLRAGLTAARSEAITRLITQVSQARAQGQFDDADTGIRRGVALEPGNPRLLAYSLI